MNKIFAFLCIGLFFLSACAVGQDRAIEKAQRNGMASFIDSESAPIGACAFSWVDDPYRGRDVIGFDENGNMATWRVCCNMYRCQTWVRR